MGGRTLIAQLAQAALTARHLALIGAAYRAVYYVLVTVNRRRCSAPGARRNSTRYQWPDDRDHGATLCTLQDAQPVSVCGGNGDHPTNQDGQCSICHRKSVPGSRATT